MAAQPPVMSFPVRFRANACALGMLVAAVVLGACGSSEEPAAQAPDYEAALRDAPPPLAALYDESNELLGGGVPAYEARLEELRGFPVVVNKWASWCGPCRAEFPWFQSLAAAHGDEVAFLGVNSNDGEETAADFLAELPLPYPSYVDPKLEIAASFDAATEFPATAFYDSEGELVHVRRGVYGDEAELEADIERYAR
jgi:cytochrome c biogenesis protein CcmG, thiol:disulfide interchange protein DsbE